MNSRYFLILAAIVTAQASGALEIEIDGGEPQFGEEVVIRRANGPPPADDNDVDNGNNNNDVPDPPTPTNGIDCPDVGEYTLFVENLRRGQSRHRLRDREILALRFTEGDVSSSIQFGESTDGPSGRKHITISECPGDFNLTHIANNCSRTGTSGTIWLQFGDDNNSRRSDFACRLEPDGRTYYLNVMYRDPSDGSFTCGTGRRCGVIVTN